jgi:hypothetical protein
MNVFIALGKWAERQGENYSTELFAFLLSYLLDNDPRIGLQLLAFVTNGFFPAEDERSRDVKISTQVRTEHGIPDIELRSSDAISLIEVKAGARLGKKQLESYRSILDLSGAPDTQLILLTKYLVPSRTHEPDYALRWFQIAEKLEDLILNKESSSVSEFLVDQFLGYLRSRNMALVEVKSPISEALKSHEQIYGDEALRFKRVRSLAQMDRFPELAPLRNILQMMGEALDAVGYEPKPRLDSGQHQGGWIGYNLFAIRYFFTVYYTNPEDLVFETNLGKGDIRPNIDVSTGCFASRGGYSYWENRLDLAQPSRGFLSMKRSEQFELIKEFCKSSLEQAEVLRLQPKS